MVLPDINIIPNVEEFDKNSTPSPSESISIKNLATGSNRNLTNIDRIAIYSILLKKSTGSKLSKIIVDQIAADWGVNPRTIRRIWIRGTNIDSVCHLRTSKAGRKRIPVELSSVSQIPLSELSTLRSLAGVINVPPTRVYRAMKAGSIRRTSNPLKPFLTDVNKRARLEFCLSMIDQSTIQHEPSFKNMYNVVHIDEKWFYMTKKSQRYYLLPEEENPLRKCKRKNFIAKVMFLAATARPRFDSFMNETFSENIGVFPFLVQVPTKRNSANRIADTLETKPITSVTRDIMRSFIVEKVLLAIKEKWSG